MIVITRSTITTFIKEHATASEALRRWYDIVTDTDWHNLRDIQNDFNHVDYVGNDRYVFNIKGNDFRLVAMIHFDIRTLYIRFIGTHSAYDKIDCSII